MKKINLRRLLSAVLSLVMVLSLFTACSKKEEIEEKKSNSYTTPLDLEIAVKNAKTYNAYEEAQLKLSNSLAEAEATDLLKIMKKAEEYDEDDMKEAFEERVEDYEDEYGKNYKFYYEVEDEDKIDKDDLKDIEDELQDSARDMYDEIMETDTDDLEELAEMMGLEKSDAEELVKILNGYYKKMKKAKITEGYELEVTYYVKGSELDEPEELSNTTVSVYKVNDCWVALDNLDIGIF